MITVLGAFAVGIAVGVIAAALFSCLVLACGGAIWRWRRGS